MTIIIILCILCDSRFKVVKDKVENKSTPQFYYVTHVILEMYMWSNEIKINVNSAHFRSSMCLSCTMEWAQ